MPETTPLTFKDPGGHSAAQNEVLDPNACPGLLFGGSPETWQSPACGAVLAGTLFGGAMADAEGRASAAGNASRLAFPGGLAANDALGRGHVLSHVGLSDAELAARGIPRASTFLDRATA